MHQEVLLSTRGQAKTFDTAPGCRVCISGRLQADAAQCKGMYGMQCDSPSTIRQKIDRK